MTLTERYRPVWRSSPLAIFAVVPEPGQPEPAALLTTYDTAAEAVLRRNDPEHIVIDARTTDPSVAVVAVGWSPAWDVRIEGRRQKAQPSEAGGILIQLPIGQSRITLDYRHEGWGRVGMAITVVTGVGLAMWLAWSLLPTGRFRGCRAAARAPRRSPPPSASGDGASRGCCGRGSSTVFSLMYRSSAMSRLHMPLATSLRTSSSRLVSVGAGNCCFCSPAWRGLELGEQLRCHRRRDEALALHDRPDGVGDLLDRDLLEQVAVGAGLDGLEEVVLLVETVSIRIVVLGTCV